MGPRGKILHRVPLGPELLSLGLRARVRDVRRPWPSQERPNAPAGNQGRRGELGQASWPPPRPLLSCPGRLPSDQDLPLTPGLPIKVGPE